MKINKKLFTPDFNWADRDKCVYLNELMTLKFNKSINTFSPLNINLVKKMKLSTSVNFG